MLDFDLAHLYGVTTGNLNKSVKRNINRFPRDFMFQLNEDEYKFLVFQNGISKIGKGGRRFQPYAFTEHGILMLSSVLKSERAINVNIYIVRMFVRMRQQLRSNIDLQKRVVDNEQKIKIIVKMIEQIIQNPEEDPDERKIGFKIE